MEFCKKNLSTGVRVPAIGFGTGVVRRYTRNPYLFSKVYLRYVLSSVKHMKIHKGLYSDLHMPNIVAEAARKGYRLFDSGRIYAYSEPSIGKGLAKTNIARENFFLTTKISDMDITRNSSPETVEGNLEDSLRYLNAEYIDAYLLHWPHGKWLDIYHQMESVYQKRRARAIGVCNFQLEHFRRLESEGGIRPMLCQLELHPLHSRRAIREYCDEHNIVIMAHTPTGRMCEKIRMNPALQELAKKYGKSITQIILRWHYQNGIIPIVATTSLTHMEENMDIFNFDISQEDVGKIEDLDEQYVMLPGNGIDDPNYIYNL